MEIRRDLGSVFFIDTPDMICYFKNMKTIIVRAGRYKEEFVLDPSVFDDSEYNIYLEAVIRFVEKIHRKPLNSIPAVIKCFDKSHKNNLNHHHYFNTYYILLRARLYTHAQCFRDNFEQQMGVDISNGPIEQKSP